MMNQLRKRFAWFMAVGILCFTVMSIEASEVKEPSPGQTEDQSVDDIDLGDYASTMSIGETQVLTVTTLPLGTEGVVAFHSTNKDIATVNGMGRITALQEGNTTIQVSCNTVVKEIFLTVEREKSDTEEVPITDIDLGNYETEVEIDATISISAMVVPSNATDTVIYYSSSNPSVATVTSQGEIKGMAQGETVITIQAGSIVKTVNIRVKVAAKTIRLDTTYVVLKAGATYEIKATALPKESNQALSYKVLDTKIAAVSGKGVITANTIGNTSVIVSNGEATNSITVIVNETGEKEVPETEKIEENLTDLTVQEQYVMEQINGKEEVRISAKENPVISTNILRELHRKQKKLIIDHEAYEMILDGKHIVNYENELNTAVELKTISAGLQIIVNEKKRLPGAVEVVRKKGDKYKYLYLLHEAKGNYERIEYTDTKAVLIDVEGVYVLSNQKLEAFQFKKVYFYVIGVVVIGLIGTYIYVKKKHWFW